MNRSIQVTDIEPAALSIRHPLGINLDLKVRMTTVQGNPVDPTDAQFVLFPRSRGGLLPYDMRAFDVANGIAQVEIPGSTLTDVSGYNIEMYARTANAVPGDPPLPVALVAKGALVPQGGAYASYGPLSMINIPVVVGPPGQTGEQGVPGPTGPRGSVWFTGTGNPTMTSDSFVTGDMYLDNSTGNVWRWETETGWTRQ